jgi:hypothetical protein
MAWVCVLRSSELSMLQLYNIIIQSSQPGLSPLTRPTDQKRDALHVVSLTSNLPVAITGFYRPIKDVMISQPIRKAILQSQNHKSYTNQTKCLPVPEPDSNPDTVEGNFLGNNASSKIEKAKFCTNFVVVENLR